MRCGDAACADGACAMMHVCKCGSHAEKTWLAREKFGTRAGGERLRVCAATSARRAKIRKKRHRAPADIVNVVMDKPIARGDVEGVAAHIRVGISIGADVRSYYVVAVPKAAPLAEVKAAAMRHTPSTQYMFLAVSDRVDNVAGLYGLRGALQRMDMRARPGLPGMWSSDFREEPAPGLAFVLIVAAVPANVHRMNALYVALEIGECEMKTSNNAVFNWNGEKTCAQMWSAYHDRREAQCAATRAMPVAVVDASISMRRMHSERTLFAKARLVARGDALPTTLSCAEFVPKKKAPSV